MFDSALLLAAAFVAGALNAVAGGGSFLTLPALVFTGVPPVTICGPAGLPSRTSTVWSEAMVTLVST